MVRGRALPAFFAGKEFGDGVHFAYRFAQDRTFSGTEMGKDVKGRWRVQGDQMCWLWLSPPSPEECYDVQKDGSEIRVLVNGSEAWSGRLQPARR